MVSLLEVSLGPDRVGGSPLSLKQPKFPGTVERQEEETDKQHAATQMQSVSHADTLYSLYKMSASTFFFFQQDFLGILRNIHHETQTFFGVLFMASSVEN